MRYQISCYVILALALVGLVSCCDTCPEERIRYGDRVKIISGFFKGCEGIAKDYNEYSAASDNYYVHLIVCDGKLVDEKDHIDEEHVVRMRK